MATLDKIKNSLVNKIMATENRDLLQAVQTIFESSQMDNLLPLNAEQIEMLKMSEKDIEEGNIISESDLEKSDSEWLN